MKTDGRVIGGARPWLIAGGIFLVALLARLHGIGAMPFWLDEITTVHRVALPLPALVSDSLRAHHLPSYFWLTAHLAPGGLAEASLRLPAALFGAASAALLGVLGNRMGGVWAGLAAGLLLALSPLHVQYGQEARSYTLVILMMTVALAGFIEIARDPVAAGSARGAAGFRLWPWLLYALGTAAALQVLSTAFFWLIAANLAAVPLVLAPAVARGRFLRRWLLAQGFILLTTLPWFAAMALLTHGRMGSGTDWVPPMTWHSFLSTLGSLYGLRVSRLISFHLFPAAVPGLGLLLPLLFLMGLVYLGRKRACEGERRTLLLAMLILALAPPLLLLALSFAKPLWMPRYVMWGSVPFFLIAGLGLGLLPKAGQRGGAALALGLLAAINLAPYYRAETKPRWDLAAQDITRLMQPGDLLLVPDRGPITMMNFFLAPRHQAIDPKVWTRDVFAAAAHLDQGGRVWVISGKVGQADPTSRRSFAQITRPLGNPAASRAEGDLITLSLYNHPPGADLLAQANNQSAGTTGF